MKKSLRTLPSALLVMGTLFAAGCGGGAADLPDYAPVSGTVTMDGKPLGGAEVTFTPKSGKKLPSVGVTNSEGKYELMLNRVMGAVIGEHSVRISKKTYSEASHDGGEAPKAKKKKAASAHGHGAGGGAVDAVDDGGVQLVHNEFSGPTPALTATVEPGDNNFDFEVRGM